MWIGRDRLDWAIDLGTGSKGNNNEWNEYAEYELKKGERVTCTVDTEQGIVSFNINGEDKGIAFKDETIK